MPRATLPIDTNIDNLLSAKLQWRQLDIAYRAAFPQTADLILVVIDAPTPEQSQGAARALVDRLAGRPELFRSVQDAGNSAFFPQNGLLFQSPADVSQTTQQFTNAGPVIGGLAHDPESPRGHRRVVRDAGQREAGIRLTRLHGAAAEPCDGDA